MKTVQAELLFSCHNALGEGPLWHPAEGCLYWVDIDAGELYTSNPAMTGFSSTHFDTPLGAFCFRKSGGFILATGAGFLAWSHMQGEPSLLWNPLPPRSGVRLNDGKVDPAGRFWAGSIDTQLAQGELYRLDPDSSQHIILGEIGISNGLGWSPDRSTMYYTDSLRYTIYAFDFDLATGTIQNRRPFVQLPKNTAEIVPDGLCVDAEGCVWSAQWNGWGVLRYSPEGEPLMKVSVPAQRVTSCCFGGEGHQQLFITTARTGLSPAELADQPHAGDVFTLLTDTTGQPPYFFG